MFLFFWGLFGLLTEDIRRFAFHLFSYKLRIVDRLQNIDDRQSLERARHGLKKIHKRVYLHPSHSGVGASVRTSAEPSSCTAYWILRMVFLNSCNPFACFCSMF